LGIPLVIRAAMIALLGIVPAVAGSPGRYDDYNQGVYLPYANAPGPGEDITALPRLRISFGGRSYGAVMDTGSTGVVVSADKIPNIASLQSLGAGELTYSSSGRIMIGQWVVTPMTITGGDGTRITTAPIAVLAVIRIACTQRARRCTPNEAPRRVSMMGIGFGRRSDAQTGPQKNPFLNIAKLNGDSVNGERIRRGYIVTRRGVHVGLTGFLVREASPCAGLARLGSDARLYLGQWRKACRLRQRPDGYRRDRHVPHGAGHSGSGRHPHHQRCRATLVAGTKLTISIPAEDSPQALYTFAVGDDLNPLAPRKLNLVERSRPPFVNTSVSFLNGFDYLYDADGGFVGLRWTGHASPAFGKVAPNSPSN
jgi:hypothetical protein